MRGRADRAEAILRAAGLTPSTGAASDEYRRSDDFASGVRFVAMTFLRRRMDGFGVQFYGSDAENRGRPFEGLLGEIDVRQRGHTNRQLTLVREIPWHDGEIDAFQVTLTKWAAAGIVAGVLRN